MKRATLGAGIILVLLGLGFYLGAAAGGEQPHWTALIPAFPGALLVVSGIMARAVPAWNKHLMHGAMVIAVLLVLAGLRQGLSGLGDPGTGTIASLLMALVALVYLVVGVRSFISARRARGVE